MPQCCESQKGNIHMLIIRVDEGEALPLARSGYRRVLLEEWNSHGIRHVVFIPAEAAPQMHRGYSDIVAVINYIRQVAPGLAIRKGTIS